MPKQSSTALANAQTHDPAVIESDNAFLSPTASPMAAIMLDERLFNRATQMAQMMAKAKGFVPPHLAGSTEGCFAVVTRALTWRLDPFAVMQSTFATPAGQVGYEAKLVQAILERSGQLEGGIEREYYGDWTKIQGKFEFATSQKGNKYTKPAWKDADENGVGIIIRAQVKGRSKMDEMHFDLRQAQPRNSTLWATDPKTQIYYAAVRRFASTTMPSLIMGVPFEDDVGGHHGPAWESARDVTPKRTRSAATQLDSFATSVDGTADTVDPETGEIDTSADPVDDSADRLAAAREAANDIAAAIRAATTVGAIDEILKSRSADLDNIADVSPQGRQWLDQQVEKARAKLEPTPEESSGTPDTPPERTPEQWSATQQGLLDFFDGAKSVQDLDVKLASGRAKVIPEMEQKAPKAHAALMEFVEGKRAELAGNG